MLALHISRRKKYVCYNKFLLSLIVSTISGGSVIFIKGLHSAEYYFSNVTMFISVPIILVGANYLFNKEGKALYQKLPSTIYMCCFCVGLIGLFTWGYFILQNFSEAVM